MNTILKTSDSAVYTGFLRSLAMSSLEQDQIDDYLANPPAIAPETFVIDITTTQNQLTYKLSLNNTIIHNYSIQLSVIKNHPRFSSQSFWNIQQSPTNSTSTPIEVSEADVVYCLDTTFATKRPQMRLPTDPVCLPIDIFFSSESTNFSNCTIRVTGCATNTLIVKLNGQQVTPTLNTNWKDIFSTITLTSSGNHSAGSPIEVTVNSSQTDLEYVVLEQGIGSLDRTTAYLTNGVGKFNILTDTLNAGETVVAYVGFKRYTKAATFTATLI